MRLEDSPNKAAEIPSGRVTQANQHSGCISVSLLFLTAQTHIHTPVCLLQKKPPCVTTKRLSFWVGRQRGGIKHLARFWWQPHSPSTGFQTQPRCQPHATATEDERSQCKSHQLFSTQWVLKLHCQPAEIVSLLHQQRGGWKEEEESLWAEPHLTSRPTADRIYQLWCCVPGEGLTSWPVNCPERVPVRPQVQLFPPEPAARGEEAQPYLWREVPAAGDLRVLLQKRSHLGVQSLAGAPVAAALPAQRGASPPAPPGLGRGVLPAHEEQPLPAAEGHASLRTNPPGQSSEHSLSEEHSRWRGRKLGTNSRGVVLHSDGWQFLKGEQCYVSDVFSVTSRLCTTRAIGRGGFVTACALPLPKGHPKSERNGI